MKYFLLLLALTFSSSVFAVGPSVIGQSGPGNFTIKSSGISGLKMFSVRVDVDDAGNSISSFVSLGDWISSVTRAGEGNYSIEIKAGIFSSTPHCWGSTDANHEAGGEVVVYRYTASTSTSAALNLVNNSNTLQDEDFVLACFGL